MRIFENSDAEHYIRTSVRDTAAFPKIDNLISCQFSYQHELVFDLYLIVYCDNIVILIIIVLVAAIIREFYLFLDSSPEYVVLHFLVIIR